jgi:hypothetical protein
MTSRDNWLPADLLAAAEEQRQNSDRTATQQIELWARAGMLLERKAHLGHPGDSDRDVAPSADQAANAVLDAAISTDAQATSFAARLAARGSAVVVLDEEGRVVRLHPDGTTGPL